MTTTEQIEWLNPKQVAEQYGFSVSTLGKWRMKKRNLRFSKIGKYIRYSKSDLEAFLESNLVEVSEIQPLQSDSQQSI